MHAISLSPRATIGQDLLDLPLVRQMLNDPAVPIIRRGTDQEWTYEKFVSTSAAGWNPLHSAVYIGRKSATADLLDKPQEDLRSLNEGDALMSEVMFAVHDYLHAWAVRNIWHLVPERGLGHATIDSDNIEDMAFMMLLTEAVATVGLDYWYLSNVAVSKKLDLGSPFTTLTVSYQDVHLEEYRRFNPRLDVQSREWFDKIANFYCTGELYGFSNDALNRSPHTFKWLKHELSYSETQRVYTRQWLEHFAGKKFFSSKEQRGAPVACDAPWQQNLIATIGDKLYRKVKGIDDELSPVGDLPETWKAPQEGPIDFRTTNALSFGDDLFSQISKRGIVDSSFQYLFNQLLSNVDYHAAPRERLLNCLQPLRSSRSPELLLAVLGPHKKVETAANEPVELFFAG